MQAKQAIPIICALLLCTQNVQGAEIETQVHQTPGPGSIDQLLETKRKALMALPNVVGAGLGMCGGTACIKVLVLEQTPELRRQLDTLLGQVPYVVEQSGSFHTLPAEKE